MAFLPKYSPALKSSDELLNHLLSATERILVGSIITASYRTVQEFLSTEAPEWLTSPHACKLIPEMKNMAVEYALAQACDKHVIPLTYDLGAVPSTKAVYFEMHSKDENVSITVNQTRSANRVSREAKFRSSLFDAYDSRLVLFEDEKRYLGSTYLELNHGYQSLAPKFVVLGKPGTNNCMQAGILLPTGVSAVNSSENDDIKTTANEMAAFGPDEFRRFASGGKSDER